MTAVTLHRDDATRNLHRYYRLDLQPDLFGDWCFIRKWGRIGSAGQTRIVPFPTAGEAEEAFARHQQAKERRGYSDACLIQEVAR